jgi:hypothetical protein
VNRAIVRFAVLAFILAALPAAAQSGAWTAVGSTGAIGEISLGIYSFAGPVLQHRAGINGTVLANYNVTNTFGGGVTDVPPWTTLEVTWFDSSPNSFISAALLGVDRCTGAVTFLCNINSVDNPTVVCPSCTFPAGSINFGTTAYFVQVRMARNLNTVIPQVFHLRIF